MTTDSSATPPLAYCEGTDSADSRSEETSRTDSIMSDFPSRVKLSKCTSGETASRSKDNVRDSKSLDQTQVTRALQSLISKVNLEEEALAKEKVLVQELTETCDRQEENMCHLQCEIDKIGQRMETERRNQQLFESKIKKTMNICNGIHQNFEALGTAFNFIVPQATAAQEFVEDMKQKAEDHSNFFNEMMNVQVPNFVEYLENAVREQKEYNKKMRGEIQEKMKAVHENQTNEKESLLQDLSQKKAQLSDLESQIAQEKATATFQIANLERLSQEKMKHKETLTIQLEQWNKKNETAITEIDQVRADVLVVSTELKKLQTDLAQASAREEQLKDEFLKAKEGLGCLVESLSVKKEQQEKVDSELLAQAHVNKELERQLEEVREKLQESKDNTKNQLNELEENFMKESLAFSEEERNLLQSINELKEKDRSYKEEANIVENELLQIRKELENERENQSKILEANNLLETQLSSCQQEIENLNREVQRQNEELIAEQETASSKESILSQSRIEHNKVMATLEQQIESVQVDEKALLEELRVLEIEEQDILIKIDALQRDDSLSNKELIEKHEKDILDLENVIAVLNTEIEDISNNGKNQTSELQQKIAEVSNELSKKESEFTNLEVSIASLKGELEGLTKSKAALSAEKQEKLSVMTELSEKINSCTEALKKKKRELQELKSQVDDETSKIEEADLQMTELSKKFQNAQAEFSKLIAENESAKQAFARDHVKFQKTCEYRQDEVVALQKQITVWETKIESTQSEITSLRHESLASEQSAKAAEDGLREIDSEIDGLRANILSAEKQAKSSEKQAAWHKQKIDELNEKVRRHKEERAKAKSENSAEVFKMPMQGSLKKSTPESIAPRVNEQLSLSPQTKNPVVNLDDSMDGSQSSASTIVLVPSLVDQIAVDPGVLRILTNQQRDRQAAKRRMRTHVEESTPSKKKVAPENEISSSTPEEASHSRWQL